MKPNVLSPNNPYFGLFVAVFMAAVFLLVGIGSFGMWEPHETDRAEIVDSLAQHRPLPQATAPGLHIEERLAAVGWAIGNKTEASARIPLALLAILTVAALFLLLLPLTGAPIASFAAIAFSSAPVLLFHGRQLTSGMPTLFGEVLAIGGLALVVSCPRAVPAVIGAVAAATGLVLGWLSGGLLMGVAVPAAIVALAAAYSRKASGEAQGDSSPRARQFGPLALAAGVLAVLSASGFLAIAVFSDQDIPLITGGLAESNATKKTFDFAFEQIVYGWFPWSALVPIAVLGLFRSDDTETPQSAFLRGIVVAGVGVGFLAQNWYVSLHGVVPCFLAVPMVLGAALAIDDLRTSKEPLRLFALFAIVLLIVTIRDFAQEPETILYGYGFDKIPLPKKEFNPVIKAALFSIPAGLLILSLGMTSPVSERGIRLKSMLTFVLTAATAVSTGVFISFLLVPELSTHLSSKHAIDIYKQYRKGDEPLAVFGPNRLFSDATKLNSRADVVSWLGREDRVFVLFPPKDLGELNRRFREDTSRHIFVLDGQSERFTVATSKPAQGEKNNNPLMPFVQSVPFVKGPANAVEVNFDNKLTLLGWELKNNRGGSKFSRGKKYTMTTYWRVEAPLKTRYKFFMHIDGPGGRLHGDHDPLGGKLSTDKWLPGDYIKDVYKGTVPSYQKSGKYVVRIGLYKGSTRLKIRDEPRSSGNSLKLADIMLN